MKKIQLKIIILFLLCTSLYCEEPPGRAPTNQESPFLESSGPVIDSYQHAFLKMFGALFILLALVFIAVWAMRRLSQGRLRSMANRSSIKILERRPISPKSVLYRIEVSGKEILISESQFEVRCLTSISEELPSEEERT